MHCSKSAVHLIAFSAHASNIDCNVEAKLMSHPVALNLEALAVFKSKAKSH